MLGVGGIVLRERRPFQYAQEHASSDNMNNFGQLSQKFEEIDEYAPVWRETPLDHWSKEIDPVIMAGDEWVEPIQSEQDAREIPADPGAKWWDGYQESREPGAPFLHPTHDVTYRGTNDMTDDTSDKGLNEWEGV